MAASDKSYHVPFVLRAADVVPSVESVKKSSTTGAFRADRRKHFQVVACYQFELERLKEILRNPSASPEEHTVAAHQLSTLESLVDGIL